MTTCGEVIIAATDGFGARIPLLHGVGAVSNRELPWTDFLRCAPPYALTTLPERRQRVQTRRCCI